MEETTVPAFSDAFESILHSQQQHGNVKLHKCVIQLDALTENDTGSLVDGVLDLDFLDPLRTNKDFLPRSVFVRQEMRTMFTRLVLDKPGEEQKVLVGSPGIGKSVLFFLAALRRSVAHGEEVMYVRKTRQQRQISFFLVERRGDSSVNVLFNRALSRLAHPDLGQMCVSLVQGRVDDFYIMLDGPHHDDPAQDRLQDDYHALCTSAGYPARAQEQIGVLSILVLNGWNETSIKEGLTALRKTTNVEADEIYELSGGRIRLALMGKEEIEEWYDEVIAGCGNQKIKLAVTSQAKPGIASSSDRLRTRFYDPSTNTNRMVVDSQYVFRKLIGELKSSDMVDAYNLATALKLQAARGWFYEEILNRRFVQHENMQAVQGWLKSEGTGAEGVDEFIKECLERGGNIYWVPSIPNFANIDAAILVDSILTCFQYTVKKSHTFDEKSFWENLVGRLVLKGVQIQKVRVVFVTPSDVEFDNNHQDYTKEYSFAQGTQTRTKASAIQKKMPVLFSAITVEVDHEGSFDSHIETRLLPLLTRDGS